MISRTLLTRLTSRATRNMATTTVNNVVRGTSATHVMTGKYAGMVVVVSGASSGIGEEISLQYAKEGASLVLSARRRDKLQSVADQCIATQSPNQTPTAESSTETTNLNSKSNVVVCVSDVSVEADCQRLVQTAVDTFGGIDILVLNAGVGQSFFLEAMHSDFNIRQYMDVNYYGCVYPTIAALPHLQKSTADGGGRIVVVSSLGGLIPFPRQTLYNASKYALLGFFDTLRMELQAKGSKVSISTICPGFIKTEITAGGGLGRDGKPVGTSMDPAANKISNSSNSPTDSVTDAAKTASKPKKTSAGGGIQMISAADCAQQAIAAAEIRAHTTIIPKYPYLIIYNLRKFFPRWIDALLIKMYAPPPKPKNK